MPNYIKDLRKKIGHDPIFVPAVGAIIYKNGKILMQKRADDGTWATHGGAIEFGETLEQALERELKEEINVKPINPKFLGIYSGEKMYHEYPNKDKAYLTSIFFIVENYEGEPKIDEDEVLDLKWFDINEMPDNLFNMDVYALNDFKEYLENKQIIIN